jgi:hypothetical protein
MYTILEKNMFTNDNLIKYNEYLIKSINTNKIDTNKIDTNKINTNKINTNKINTNKINTNKINYFIPKTNDKLFWIFYVILYGFDKFNLNSKYEFKTEKQFKIELVDKLRKNKSHVKLLKYKISDLENELVNESKITLKIFHLMCFLFDKSVLYVNNKIYYDFNYGNDYKIVEFNNNNPQLINSIISTEFINNIKNNYILINLAKPLKGVSSYKIKDLQDIAFKLNIDIMSNLNKKKVKQQLYDEIFLKIKKLM